MIDPVSSSRAKQQVGWIVAALIVLAFAAIIFAKAGSGATAEAPASPAATQPSEESTGGPSQSHADATAAYDAALKSGKPVYLLFHSLTCDPCIEISNVVDKVIGDYEGKVVFVNAITTDEPAKRLAGEFQFQYIPHSFFLDANGTVVDQFEGAMDETAMRGYLDKLAAR